MRVISGTAKGRPLYSPEGTDTRPTLDKVKEAVFGSIQFDVPGSVFVDMFSGSGAIGIESLSRGASKCYFVDNDRKAVEIIRKNIASCGFSKESIVLNCSYDRASVRMERADIVYMDPPYRSGVYQDCLEKLCSGGVIDTDTLVIAEHDGSLELSGFREIKNKKYGNTFVSYFRKDI